MTSTRVHVSFRELRRAVRHHEAAAAQITPRGNRSAMLLLFYATECALKAVVLRQRNAASTEALDDSLRSHDLGALTKSLRVSAEVGRDVEATYDRRANQGRPMPKVSLARTHEVWRYGANLTDDSNARVKVLLDRLRDWARNELSL